MKKEIEVEISVSDAIETLREAIVFEKTDKKPELLLKIAEGLDLMHLCNLLPILGKCNRAEIENYKNEFRSLFPISIEEAIEIIEGTGTSSAFRSYLSEGQQTRMFTALRDNPQALALLASRSWSDSDIFSFLKDHFGNKGYTGKEELITNISEFIQNS